MSEHSPVPWESRPVPDGAVVTRVYFDEEGRRTTVFVASCLSATADNLANARLIVRACNAHDDLLAACEAALEHMKTGCWAGLSHGCCGPPEVGAVVRAAIAKARGEGD